MSAVLHFYPGDQAIAGAALAVLAISIVAAAALVAAKLLERRPPLRYSVLAAAVLCILATPLIAILDAHLRKLDLRLGNCLRAVGPGVAVGKRRRGFCDRRLAGRTKPSRTWPDRGWIWRPPGRPKGREVLALKGWRSRSAAPVRPPRPPPTAGARRFASD